jgi:uncharacterized protein (TIRG00374 family)
VNAAAVVLAGGALAWMLADTGSRQVFEVLRASWRAIAIVVGLDLVIVVVRARVLHVLLRPSQRMISLGRVACAQAAGSAVQDFTPTGALGDVVKGTLLLARAPATEVVGSVVAYDVLAVYVSAAIVTVGVTVAAVLGLVPPPLDQALWATAVALLVLVLLVSWMIRRGLTRSLLAATARIRVISTARRDRWAARLTTLDARLHDLHDHRAAEARQGFALLLLARAIGWLQLYVVVRAVGADPDPRTFVALVLCQIPVARLSTLLPLGVGISDLGTAGVFALLGLPPAGGLAVAMLGRVRQIVLALIAVVAMATLLTIDRLRLRRTRARLLSGRPRPARHRWDARTCAARGRRSPGVAAAGPPAPARARGAT